MSLPCVLLYSAYSDQITQRCQMTEMWSCLCNFVPCVQLSYRHSHATVQLICQLIFYMQCTLHHWLCSRHCLAKLSLSMLRSKMRLLCGLTCVFDIKQSPTVVNQTFLMGMCRHVFQLTCCPPWHLTRHSAKIWRLSVCMLTSCAAPGKNYTRLW